MQTMTASELQSVLKGYSLVLELHVRASIGRNDNGDVVSGKYDLTMSLADGDAPDSKVVKVRFVDVSDMRVEAFGGGLVQFLCLEVVDFAPHQWERVRLEVRETEHGSIRFRCLSAEVLE